MTFEVQQTRWDRIIRRVSGSIGPGSRVEQTLSELFPVLDVERVPAELLLLGGTQIAMGQIRLSPLAANFNQIMIRNPGGSQALLTVTQVAIFSTTAQIIRVGLTLNTFPTAGAEVIRDARRALTDPPVGQVLGDQLLVASPFFFTFRVNGSDTVFLKDINELAVLPPGTALTIGANTVNTNLEVGFMWRERPAEESELQF